MPYLYTRGILGLRECGLVEVALYALDSGNPSWVFDARSGELVGAKSYSGGFAGPPNVCDAPQGAGFEARAGVELDGSCPVVTVTDLCARDVEAGADTSAD
jgi:hypothetical protein